MTAAQRRALSPRTARMLRELEGPRVGESARSPAIEAGECEAEVARPRGSARGRVRPLAHALFALGVVLVVVVGALHGRAPGSNDDVRQVAGPAVPTAAAGTR